MHPYARTSTGPLLVCASVQAYAPQQAGMATTMSPARGHAAASPQARRTAPPPALQRFASLTCLQGYPQAMITQVLLRVRWPARR
jgi:hypothetical protein